MNKHKTLGFRAERMSTEARTPRNGEGLLQPLYPHKLYIYFHWICVAYTPVILCAIPKTVISPSRLAVSNQHMITAETDNASELLC